jgi:hypothetical protein
MDSKDLQQLANIATVKTHIANILNTGRGVVPKPQLHKLQQEGMKLDKMFVDLLLNSSAQQEKDDVEDISKRIAEEKAKLKTSSVKRVSVEEATVAAINDVLEKKPAKKNVKASKQSAVSV